MRILRDIGVLDDVVFQAGESERTVGGTFRFLSGMDDHRMVYDVSFLCPTAALVGLQQCLVPA